MLTDAVCVAPTVGCTVYRLSATLVGLVSINSDNLLCLKLTCEGNILESQL